MHLIVCVLETKAVEHIPFFWGLPQRTAESRSLGMESQDYIFESPWGYSDILPGLKKYTSKSVEIKNVIYEVVVKKLENK